MPPTSGAPKSAVPISSLPGAAPRYDGYAGEVLYYAAKGASGYFTSNVLTPAVAAALLT